jgi:hypothetical protein
MNYCLAAPVNMSLALRQLSICYTMKKKNQVQMLAREDEAVI